MKDEFFLNLWVVLINYKGQQKIDLSQNLIEEIIRDLAPLE